MKAIKCELCDKEFKGSEHQIAFLLSLHKQGEKHMAKILKQNSIR